MAEMTPMMRQYLSIKEEYPDTILFFRLGDFYEMFFDDARIVSKELDLVLTGKDCGLEERAPMCGVPFHAVDSYIAKLVSRGYKIAICEQMEDPAKAKGLVKRDVTRILTPGTIIESSILDEDKNNYLASFFYDEKVLSCVFVDISTGSVFISSIETENVLSELMNEFAKYFPSEVIIDKKTCAIKGVEEFFRQGKKVLLEKTDTDYFEYDENKTILEKNISDFESILPSLYRQDVCCLGACIKYLSVQYKTELKNIKAVNVQRNNSFMSLNFSSRRNLELTETMRNRDKKGSLLWVLDKTRTPLGKRKIRSYLDKPLLDYNEIVSRQNAVSDLYEHMMLCDEIRELLYNVNDIERIMTRVIYGSVNARELRSFANAISNFPEIKQKLSSFSSKLLTGIFNDLDTLEDLYDMIDSTILDDPAQTVRDGKIIKTGFNSDLDELKSIEKDISSYLTSIEERERERTGIPKIKISFNKVFGYYIEVTNLYKDKVPEDYIRKQTLTNCERFITQELKDLESKIISSKEKVVMLEYEIFCQVRDTLASQYDRVHKSAEAIAALDAICSLAYVARKNDYCRPEITTDGKIEIVDGRHPVVEKMLRDSLFVPNDTNLDLAGFKCALITGPNMAGKSTYMRQVALIVIMAQIGSFVPASRANISICDSIFTRVGASDDLASGQSTFMVEMTEVADILKRATKNSLVIFDEIGRGTSTYDGMSIARAVLEYTTEKIGAKSLFATHYHELTILEDEIDCVKNYNIAVKKRGDDITFLRRIVRGPADGSYGVEVSKIAGVPNPVVKRAREILDKLEEFDKLKPNRSMLEYYKNSEEDSQISLTETNTSAFVDEIKDIDVNTLTPIEAMSKLYDIVSKASKL